MAKKKALFLDRDGVIIDYVPYLSKVEQVSIPVGAEWALKRWQDAGYLLVIVTNQSGVGRGYFSMEAVSAVHQYIDFKYQKYGIEFKDILLCTHHPDQGCACRKPSPLLISQAAAKHNIDVSKSFFIGDAPTDIDCARQSGCQPVLVLTGRGAETADLLRHQDSDIPIFKDLAETTTLIPA